jgi:hypothetical protein
VFMTCTLRINLAVFRNKCVASRLERTGEAAAAVQEKKGIVEKKNRTQPKEPPNRGSF